MPFGFTQIEREEGIWEESQSISLLGVDARKKRSNEMGLRIGSVLLNEPNCWLV